jgi:hypothetical protein
VLDARPDAVLAVIDAGDLALHLPLVLACRDLGLPIVVAANLADEAEAHGISLDFGRLSQLLAAPVHRTVGRRGTGVREALTDAIRLAARRDHDVMSDDATPMTAIPPYSPALVRAVSTMAGRLRTGERPRELEPAMVARIEAGTLRPIGAATLASADRLEPERWALAASWAAQVEIRDGAARPPPTGSPGSSPRPGQLPYSVVATLGALLLTMIIGTRLAELLTTA